MASTKKPRFKHATTDTFDVPNGDLSPDVLRGLGVMLPINRGAPTTYHAKDGKIYAVRTSRHVVETMVFRYGVHPTLGGAAQTYWNSERSLPR